MGVNSNVEDFVPVAWLKVEVGDEVYLRGTYGGDQAVYGPHTVYHVERRELKSGGPAGSVFKHYQEDLMKKRKEPLSREDRQVLMAVGLLREAANLCDAADPQARDAISSLANDLEAGVREASDD